MTDGGRRGRDAARPFSGRPRACSTTPWFVLGRRGRRRDLRQHHGTAPPRSGRPTRSRWPRPRRWPASFPRSACRPPPTPNPCPPARWAWLTCSASPTRSRWTSRGCGPAGRNRDRLRVPIGIGGDGRPIELDLKESAQDGMGPHGLLGRRDRLRQERTPAAPCPRPGATHSPEILNLVLIDFKGGATFGRARPAPAHQRGHHQPGRRSCRWSTGCSAPSRAS